MYRYIALIWNRVDSQKCDTANFIQEKIRTRSKKWHNIYKQDGIMVFHADIQPGRMQAYKLQDDTMPSGVILGKIFKTNPAVQPQPEITKIADQESLKILKTEGRYLMENYWGRYVAFLYDQFQGIHYILRDPTGAFPCLYVTWQGIDIYFSDINDMLALNLVNFTRNNQYLAAYLKYEFMQTSDTGLKDVSKLLPGSCRKITPKGITSSFYWSPSAFCKNPIIEDTNKAAELLHQVTQQCVTAWTACHESIFHRLSGGLDSSIILSCLNQTPNPLKVTCLNYYTSTPDGDERRYARLAAEAAQCRLLEKQLDPSAVRLEKILNISKSAEPESYLFGIDRGDYETQLRKTHEGDAIFSGHGGDNILFQPRSSLGASDFLHNHGFQPRLFKMALEAARLCDHSVWSVLYETFKRSLQRRPCHPLTNFLPEYSSLLNSEILETVNIDDILHPWLKDVKDISPGKCLHLMLATVSPLYYEPSLQPDRQLAPINPLFSQPLIELCLQIPTYILTAGGRERGLARIAFKNNVLPEIINRESKGAGDRYYAQVFEENITFIREFLMDGILIKDKILDRRALEETLSGNQIDIEAARLQILSLICTEAWLQHWSYHASSRDQI